MTQLIDLGKLRFHFAGDWSSGTTYEPNDIVKYGGNVYVYTYGMSTAGHLPTDTIYWALMIEGFKFKGVFDTATAYKVGDGVSHGGKVYIAVLDSTNQTPPNNTYWSQFADGIQYEGSYNNSTAYQKNDVVTYGANTYIAILDTTGHLPTDATRWAIFNAGFSYQGVWSNSTAYKIGQTISYGGSFFQAKSDNQGVNPTVTATWDKVVPGLKNRNNWTTSTQYAIDDLVVYGGSTFISLEPHTSGTFATDLAGAKWHKLSSGVDWKSTWEVSTFYKVNDIVKSSGSTYICLQDHTSDSIAFNTDYVANKWEQFVVGGADVIPPFDSTDIGKSLSALQNGADYGWINPTGSDKVYYVAPHGEDTVNNGASLSTPFASVKYACTQAEEGSTIFVKTGDYYEQLPIVVPANVAIVGDNQRTVRIHPKSGNSDDGITPNANASMFLMSNGSILNKMTFMGMTGWVPGNTASDVTTSTIRGVVVRFNPNSPVTSKSPYVLECAAICTGAIGALIDGSAQASGGKTMIFHGYTVISDNGIGYWVKDGGKAEIVSCFTYYCYFGYTASGGGFIRALNGNNSYGTWGSTSRGYDSSETAATAQLYGQQLNVLYQGGNINVGDTITTSTGATAVVLNTQLTANKIYVHSTTGSFAMGDTFSTTSGGVGTISAGALENQKGFVLIMTGLAAMPKPGASISIAGDTVSYVIQSVSGTYVDNTSKIVVVLAQEKPTGSASGAVVSIRYKYSQIRLTGHDFLSIGTGGVTTTNYPHEPTQPAAQGNETDEAFPGRVYYVSTDQDGNFRVGEFFRIDQATGRATLNASAFDLAGLTSLRLGSIGAQLGETINEFSSDGTLSGNSNTAVPTEQAVKTYVDDLTASTFEPTGFNRGVKSSMGIMEFSLDGTTIHKIDENSTYSVRTDGKFATGTAWQQNATANTFAIYPVAGETSFVIWQAGIKYTFSTIQKHTVSGTMTGSNFFFIDQGALVHYTSMSGDYIQKEAFCALVYINENTSEVVLYADERHGITMDGATHYYLHTTSGTRFKSGLGAAGVTAGGTSFTSLAAGELWDEDILIPIPYTTSAPMLYRNANRWSKFPSSTSFAYLDTGVAQYNHMVSAGNYEVIGVPSGKYSVMYLMATNDRINPFVRVMGQYIFDDLAAARESAQTEPRDTVTSGLPVTEFLWVGAVVVDHAGIIQTLDTGAVYVDLRYVNISSGTNSSAAVQANAADTFFNNSITKMNATDAQKAIDDTYKLVLGYTYFIGR